MTLNITRGKQRHGERILVDGEPGIGKTAFAVGAEAPLWQARDGVLVAGLHRLEAVRSLGWADVPCIRRDGDALSSRLAEID